ncbi:DNA topoisomerase family protein [Pseudoalteromonas pernae]|uniref:DNA topoisomerase family protein n=1 Tax=Pseudoalteromonas pernae TaxID=3118054 RepID=UPI0032425254
MTKIDHSLFNADKHALEKEYEVCPECGSELVMRHSKSGAFLGCASYPTCHFIRPLHQHDTSTIKVLDDNPCPQCQAPLAVKNGRFGMFIGCTNFPECHYIADQREQEENEVSLPMCPKCNKGTLTQRSSKYGKAFYSCDAYPKCKYSINYPPVAVTCEQCQWPVMMKRNFAEGPMLQCPQKTCGHKQPDNLETSE